MFQSCSSTSELTNPANVSYTSPPILLWNVILLKSTCVRSLGSSVQAAGTIGHWALGRQLLVESSALPASLNTLKGGCISDTSLPLSTAMQR